MMSNLTLLCNFVEKYLGTIRFGNDQFALILGYEDLVQGNITINKVYYVERLNHNLFSVGQFCDADLEVAFLRSTCFVRDLQRKDLLTVSKAKRSSFKTKTISSSKGRLNLLHMDLCGPMRVASINGKKYILAEAIATACYTQNRSIIISTHEKTTYHIINDRKPSIKHLDIFGYTCYLTRDGENLDKIKEEGDPCILVGYSTQSKGYHVYNKRTRLIVESLHLKFDEIKEMSETSVANDTSGLEEAVPNVEEVSLVDGVFDCAFGGDGEEEVVMREGVMVTSSSLEMLTKSCVCGMMVSLIFLEGLDEEA
nr:integrase, catalytic region, zinc finger, CCHC-type, peptidase aspartic, catalytic [Tanacetum cinerariifolium]